MVRGEQAVVARMRRLLQHGYWSEAEGREAVEAWQASAETLAMFCRRHGVSAQRIRWWRDRVGARATKRRERVEILPVAIVDRGQEAVAERRDAIEIDVRGRAVRVGAGVDEGTLVAVLRAAEAVWRC